MSDRAKARLLAAGISLTLSAQIVVILLGALALFNRLHFGGPNGGAGSIFLAQPGAGTIVGGTGGLVSPGPAGPPGDLTGPDAVTGPQPPPPPTEPAPGGSASQEPLIGVTVEGDLPVVGPFGVPVSLGSSSGDNLSGELRVGKVKASFTASKHPLRDLTESRSLADTLRPSRPSDRRDTYDRNRHRHVRPLVKLVGRLLHSLLKG